MEQEKSLTELKADAYDAIRQIEMWQSKLMEIEQKMRALKNAETNK